MDEQGLVDDLVAAGLYDPDDPLAPARLEVLRYLVEEIGASIPELVQAAEEDRITSFAAFRSLRPGRERWTIRDAAGRAGVPVEFAVRVWRAAGFPDVRPFERRFTDADIALLAFLATMAALLSEDDAVHLARTLGQATSQIAEAEVALLRSNVEAPLHEAGRVIDIVRSYVNVAEELFPQVAAAIDTLHRHHVERVARRYGHAGAPPSATNVVPLAVGFADLSGYTGLASALDAADLGAMLMRFEAVTGDTIAMAGADLVKRIGDAVMFVTSAPGVACALGLDLVDACRAARLPKLRVGLAFGDVIVRQGDFYGPVVNLAARLVAAAEPATVLADPVLHDRLGRSRGPCAFLPAGRLDLAGFDTPVAAYQLLRT